MAEKVQQLTASLVTVSAKAEQHGRSLATGAGVTGAEEDGGARGQSDWDDSKAHQLDQMNGKIKAKLVAYELGQRWLEWRDMRRRRDCRSWGRRRSGGGKSDHAGRLGAL